MQAQRAPAAALAATPADWDTWAQATGPDHLLPAVGAADAQALPRSEGLQHLESLAKSPSAIKNARAHGFKDWPYKRASSEELAAWRGDPRLNVLLQTGRGIVALDIDIEDRTTADELAQRIIDGLGATPPIRSRPNSSKRTLIFRIENGDAMTLKKRAIKTRDGAIEFLADGSQTVVAGRHPSGAFFRTTWPESGGIPAVPLARLQAVWDELAQAHDPSAKRIGIEPERNLGEVRIEDVGSDPLVLAAQAKRLLLAGPNGEGKVPAACPFAGEHKSDPGGTGGAVILPPRTDEATGRRHPARFHCSHTTCKHRSQHDFYAALGVPYPDAHQADVTPFTRYATPMPAAANAYTYTDPFSGAIVATPTPSTRYRFESFTELSARSQPIRRAIKGVLPAKGSAIIYGPSGAGKSFLVLDMIASLVGGSDFFGHRVPGTRRVALLALEGAGGVVGRVQAWEKHTGRQFPEGASLLSEPVDLLAEADVTALAEALRAEGCQALFIDTLARAHTGDENSVQDMGRVMAAADRLARAIDGLVVLVSHSGKDQTRGLRGSTAIYAAADTVIAVERNGTARSWRVEKQKDGEETTSVHFNLESVKLGQDEDGDLITSAVVVGATPPSVPGKRLTQRTEEALTMLRGLNRTTAAGVSREVWRAACQQRWEPTGDNKPRQTFARAEKALLENRLIVIEGASVRLAGPCSPDASGFTGVPLWGGPERHPIL